jgi:hypothetical protein
MLSIYKLINTHAFFINKNNIHIIIYPFIYFIKYLSLILTTFITFSICPLCQDNNLSYLNQVYIYIINIIHIFTIISIIYHLFNEIKRELFIISNNNYYTQYDITHFYKSYIILFLSNTINIITSLILLIELNIHSIYTYLYIIYNIFTLIPILLNSYSVLIDKNYTASIIFYQPIYYIRYANIINYNKKIEHFDLNNIYPKDVFI